MHIPDGFLDAKTLVGSAAVSAGAVVYAARRTGRQLDDRQLPVLAAASAFVFAAQMVNFPIVGATSGHLLGGALLTILFGPWAACLSLTTVLVIQALLFGDGGLFALGANVLNMAVIGTLSAHLIYSVLNRKAVSRTTVGGLPGSRTAAGGTATGGTAPRERTNFRPAASFISAWASVVLASAAAALELAWAGTIPLRVALPAMLSWHLFIGVGEGIITTAVLAYVIRVRPGLLPAATEEGTA